MFDLGQSLGQHDDQHRQDRRGEGKSADDLPCCLCQKQMLRDIVRRTKMLPTFSAGEPTSVLRSDTPPEVSARSAIYGGGGRPYLISVKS